jgi:hypothetical protein
MTKEQREKASATREANAKRWAEQTITVDENWRIVRADDYNWEIQFHRKFYGYYGNLLHAFQALPAKMLGEAAKSSLATLIDTQKGICETIEKTLRLKFDAN